MPKRRWRDCRVKLVLWTSFCIGCRGKQIYSSTSRAQTMGFASMQMIDVNLSSCPELFDIPWSESKDFPTLWLWLDSVPCFKVFVCVASVLLLVLFLICLTYCYCSKTHARSIKCKLNYRWEPTIRQINSIENRHTINVLHILSDKVKSHVQGVCWKRCFTVIYHHSNVTDAQILGRI